MKEACRLLSKSIIRIEQPDIELEEDTAEEEIDAEGMKLRSLYFVTPVVTTRSGTFLFPTACLTSLHYLVLLMCVLSTIV